MNPDYRNELARKDLIEGIKSYDNVERKRKALKDYEIYNDNSDKYVYEELSKQLSKKTADQMPIISNLNIAKAVVTKEATIYIDPPVRTYSDITEKDKEALEKLYEECDFNSILSKSNKYFKLRNQAFLQVVPKGGKLKIRVLQGHNIDVVPDESDPESAYAYVISTFDKSIYSNGKSDGVNQTIADQDDYKKGLERYQIWTNEYTLVMDGKGAVLGEIFENPIEMNPFIDIAKDKDFEFFVRIGQALTDFTIDFNVAWSDLMYMSRMQGFSVGVLSGDAALKPDDIYIGPNRLLFLPTNPDNPDSKLDLDFKSPSPNIEASLKAIEGLVSTFLSTRGVDLKAVAISNSGSSYSSALEKLLAMIDQFKATKDDFSLYTSVEKQLHQIVTKYLSLLSGTNLLDAEYSVTKGIVNSKISIQFQEPQMVETTSEKLDNSQKKVDLGIADKVTVLSDIDGISIESAEEKILEIQERRSKMLGLNEGANDGANENQIQEE